MFDFSLYWSRTDGRKAGYTFTYSVLYMLQVGITTNINFWGVKIVQKFRVNCIMLYELN